MPLSEDRASIKNENQIYKVSEKREEEKPRNSNLNETPTGCNSNNASF
jgi:hypothetical protein